MLGWFSVFENAALGVKAAQDAVGVHAALDQLDRKLLARIDAAGAVHHAHAAFADALEELVAAQTAAQVDVCERGFLLTVQLGTQMRFPFRSPVPIDSRPAGNGQPKPIL